MDKHLFQQSVGDEEINMFVAVFIFITLQVIKRLNVAEPKYSQVSMFMAKG